MSTSSTDLRICAGCGNRFREKVDRCPECGAKVAEEREDSMVDKESADSFPASDPPSH